MQPFFSVLERKLNEAETEKFNIKQMKDLFEQKAGQLATEIVGKCGTREPGVLAVSFMGLFHKHCSPQLDST